MKSQITFRAWIEETGPATVARLLGVTDRTVRYWRQGRSYPRIKQIARIVRLTKGRLDYASIIDGNRRGRS